MIKPSKLLFGTAVVAGGALLAFYVLGKATHNAATLGVPGATPGDGGPDISHEPDWLKRLLSLPEGWYDRLKDALSHQPGA